MIRLFAFLSLLLSFLGAKAITVVDAEVDYSQMANGSDIPFYSWGASESAFARLSIKNGCLHFHSERAVDPSWDCQFHPIGGIIAVPGVTYTLHYKIKGSVEQNVSMLGFGQTPYNEFPITTRWVEGSVDYVATSTDGNILMQCGDYVGDWDIAYLRITHEDNTSQDYVWKNILTNGDAKTAWTNPNAQVIDYQYVGEGAELVCAYSKEYGVNNNNPHAAQIAVGSFVCRTKPVNPPLTWDSDGEQWGQPHSAGDPMPDNNWQNQFWINFPKAMEGGEQVKVTFKYRASEPSVADIQSHRAPGDYISGLNPDHVEFSTEWKTFDNIFTAGAGMRSIAFNLGTNGQYAKSIVFYFDDITASLMESQNDPVINFADSKVKALCVQNWDQNGDGELSMGEAAAVTNLGDVFKNKAQITLFNELKYFTGLTSINSYAFSGCSGLVSFTLPESVTSIQDWAFYGCNRLPSLKIPKTITHIGYAAFAKCNGLNSITVENGNPAYDSRDNCNAVIRISDNTLITGCKNTLIPRSVTSLWAYAFEECNGLISITIPSSVTSYGNAVFDGCNNLTSVTVEATTPATISKNCFSNRANATLYVPAGCKAAYRAANYWKEFKEIVEPGSNNYTLSIKATGNGEVRYGTYAVKNRTTSITVTEKTSATITFVPDNGHRIKSLKVKGVDVTSSIQNDGYTIRNITEDISVEAEFALHMTAFAVGKVNYTVTSNEEKTVVVTNGNYGEVLEVPTSITYLGVDWRVTGIDNGALINNSDLSAIVWNASVPFTLNVGNPNLLLYVKSANYAPASITNVIVGNTAERIVLTDGTQNNNFYCPREFTAKKISYTHNYVMATGVGESKGWETIALPFDVQKVTHSSRGEIVPFAARTSGDSRKPFWLMEYGSGGWTRANSIKANKPYIISMPNNTNYKPEYRLAGNITFSGEQATVKRTTDARPVSYDGKTFTPNFSHITNPQILALNVNNDYVFYSGDSNEGSRFIQDLRALHPFEAYMTTTSSARWIDISDDMTTGIDEVTAADDESQCLKVYNLNGQQIKNTEKSIDEVRHELPAGVYIVNGQKLMIRK